MKLESKQDFQVCLENIIKPLKPHYTEGKAWVKFGGAGVSYGEEAAKFEAFTRPLWGLAPLWGGDGTIPDFHEIYLEGIVHGTDPKHEEYWGDFTDFDQKIVDVTPLALALILAPEKIWTPLSESQRKNLSDWLYQVNSVKSFDNNWQFFSVLVNLGLKNVGLPYDKKNIRLALERIDSFYIGNGWYFDGNTSQKDYYIAFAIHFYGLLYAKIMEQDDPEYSKRFKERAMLFAKDFIYWFDADGSAIPFGRSLTYRFAHCCFWSACVFAGIEPFPMGVMKGIIVRNLTYWLEKPIFDTGGVLTLGYTYPNQNMLENYNAYGSPYWALKAFLILDLEDEHDFWKVKPMPLPKLDDIHVIKEADMVIQRINGYVVALTAGQLKESQHMHSGQKYSKFAYSTRYGFSVPRSYRGIQAAAPDSMLAFVKDGFCCVRHCCERNEILEDGRMYSLWSPCRGVQVETWIIPTKTGHIRKHVILSDEEYDVYDCAFATPDGLGEIQGDGESVVIKTSPNTNLVNNQTQIKAVKYQIRKGRHELETAIKYPV